MHLLKSAVSAVLLLASIFWLGVQHIFLSPDIVRNLFSPIRKKSFDIEQLKRDWCRIKSKQISWREILGPCQNKDSLMQDKRFSTSAQFSQVTRIDIKGAGEHTLVRIDTYTRYGIAKTIGGDSFRVIFRGKQVISASVFDLKNGSYDALALVTKPGHYKIDVILDYTQCNGIKDPPTEWYVKAHCGKRGSNQENGQSEEIVGHQIESRMLDYINEIISPDIMIEIPPAEYDLKLLPYFLDQMNCGFQCQQVWDGQGAWSKLHQQKNEEWFWEETRPNRFDRRGLHRNKSTLWIYGDSISYYFFKRIQSREVCKFIFRSCNNTYNWIYPKKLYELRHFCSDIDVDVNKIRDYFKEVVNSNEMDSQSVLIFNLGAHFVKNTSFRKYKQILIILINELHNYKGTIIWKSTTAIHHQNIEIMGAFRRYLTDHRVELFNAFANSLVCSSEMALLDVYPLTSSYPYGTKDGVHYHKNASLPLEKMLIEYFK